MKKNDFRGTTGRNGQKKVADTKTQDKDVVLVDTDIKNVFCDLGIVINLDDYSHYKYYNFNEIFKIITNRKKYLTYDITDRLAIDVYTHFVLTNCISEKLNSRDIDILVQSYKHLSNLPASVDSIGFFENTACKYIVEAIYSNPVDKRKKLFKEFYEDIPDTPSTPKMKWINIKNIFVKPSSDFPFITLDYKNGRYSLKRRRDYNDDRFINIEYDQYQKDELWANKIHVNQ